MRLFGYGAIGAALGIIADYALQALASGDRGISSIWYRLHYYPSDFIDGAVIGASIAIGMVLLRRSSSSAP